MDGAISRKGKKDANETDKTVKGKQKNLEGSVARKGRCKDSHNFNEVNFTTVCQSLCDESDDCAAFDVEDGKCKRFNVAEQTLTQDACKAECEADALCTAYEFEAPDECELHHGDIKAQGRNPKADT